MKIIIKIVSITYLTGTAAVVEAAAVCGAVFAAFSCFPWASSFLVASWSKAVSTSSGGSCTYLITDPRRKQFLTDNYKNLKKKSIVTNNSIIVMMQSTNVSIYRYCSSIRHTDVVVVVMYCLEQLLCWHVGGNMSIYNLLIYVHLDCVM